MASERNEHYTVVSADGHAGADLLDYRPYLPARWHDDFDAWAAGYVNPFADLLAPTSYRNWDSDRRLAELEADGVAAEVLFPNTVPPFFEQSNLTALPPTAAEYERRFAGVQAHNRWLVDFCAAAPARRAGVVQIFLNDVDDACDEVRRVSAEMEVCGGVLLPAVPPNTGLHELWDPYYEPLWELCEELDLPLNVHSGSGIPDFGDLEPARAVMLVELPWFAHRPLWHLMFGGVFDRHPGLRVALTEQGVAWLPRGLQTLEWFFARMTRGGSAEAQFFGATVAALGLTPSEYFARHVWVGASFLRPSEAPLIPEVGVERIMWGADYPHSEGSYPYTTEALRVAFAGVEPAQVRAMVTTNAAEFYGFDLDELGPLGERIGPTVDEVARPLPPSGYPTDSTCNAFEGELAVKSW
ncbi:MAG: amidohydrolase family protein [Acidimicrobiales bacterium]